MCKDKCGKVSELRHSMLSSEAAATMLLDQNRELTLKVEKLTKQSKPMRYDPVSRSEKPYPSEANQYREMFEDAVWAYDPWTGVKRRLSDIELDPQGEHIVIQKFTVVQPKENKLS